MTDRLRVRNGKLVIHAFSEKDAEHPSKATLSTNNGPKTPPGPTHNSGIKASLLQEALFSLRTPVAVYSPHHAVLDTDGSPVATTRYDHPPTIRISPLRGSVLPAADTWTEICEDLCRAMEVLSVLSDLDTGSLDPSPSTTNLQSSQSRSFALYLGPSDLWNSYVYPRLVI